jgi:hypothetical protein
MMPHTPPPNRQENLIDGKYMITNLFKQYIVGQKIPPTWDKRGRRYEKKRPE